MFQYTTETIINSNKGNLPGGKRFGVIGVGDAALQTSAKANDFLVIDGVNSFKIEYIKKIYQTPYRASEKEVAEFTLDYTDPDDQTKKLVKAGNVVRVAISLREEGSVRASMQNAYLHHRKPFFYEFVSTGTEASDASALVTLINKDMRDKDEKFFKASVSGATVTLTAMDCYIRFIVDKFNVAAVPTSNPAANLAEILLGYEDYDDLHIALTITTPGNEGQGTVARLVKNLRIPTNASINPFAADQGGKPIPGGKYDQFLIEYETPRAHVSGTVVGSVGEVSRTSHVFFIESGILNEWNTVLGYVTGATGAAATAVIPAGRPAAGESRTAGTDDAVDTISTDASGVVTLTEKDPHIGSVE